MDTIDLRSDTVSHPTPAMRAAMAKAAVGDDVYHDDPTVNQLEADAAALLGKEAAVFVSSGTQGNLCALLAHCGRGESILIGDTSHIFRYEQGGMAQLGGILPQTVSVQADGSMRLDELQAAINPDDEHMPKTRLVAIENTHNAAGGVPLSAEYTAQVADFARRNRLRFHIDGARIFNAAAAFGVEPKTLAEGADSLTFCLSKGLCAPVGSVLVGDAAFIQRARRARKVLGGSMRQAGVLAAAGLIALHEMRLRLRDDHANAQLLAEGLSEISGVTIMSQNTNFVTVSLHGQAGVNSQDLSQALREDHQILVAAYGGEESQFRLRTHYWIDRAAIDKVVKAVGALLS
ncbi:MAG: low-specificity L-threonine aldolase [Chloroflexi bacterium]|nr:low-specificity L-threonine aldolase [Chloroflexota bacterium]MCY4247789.1 low-specificity L-threonine aldolase [Chloroflexota bacterium]